MTPAARSADRGISPVVGATLMIAIVVTLATVYGSLLLDIGDVLQEPAPRIVFESSYHPTGDDNSGRPYVNLTHDSGDVGDGTTILIQDDAGNEVRWTDVWTGGDTVEYGSYVHLDGFGSDGALKPICSAGQVYRVIKRTEGGSGHVLLEFEVPAPPDPVPGWC